MKLINLIIFAACIVIMTSAAKEDDFTALERQQISIGTPRLFDHSEAFSIDYGG